VPPQPLTVLDIGLAARNVLHMPGVDQQQGEAVLQEVVDGLPVNPGGFHSHMADPPGGQPIGQGQDVLGHGAESPGLLMQSSPGLQAAHAGRHAPAVHIQATTTGKNRFHGRTRLVLLNDGGPRKSSVCLARSPWQGRQHVRVRGDMRGRLLIELAASQKHALRPSLAYPCYHNHKYFSCVMGELQAHEQLS